MDLFRRTRGGRLKGKNLEEILVTHAIIHKPKGKLGAVLNYVTLARGRGARFCNTTNCSLEWCDNERLDIGIPYGSDTMLIKRKGNRSKQGERDLEFYELVKARQSVCQ